MNFLFYFIRLLLCNCTVRNSWPKCIDFTFKSNFAFHSSSYWRTFIVKTGMQLAKLVLNQWPIPCDAETLENKSNNFKPFNYQQILDDDEVDSKKENNSESEQSDSGETKKKNSSRIYFLFLMFVKEKYKPKNVFKVMKKLLILFWILYKENVTIKFEE